MIRFVYVRLICCLAIPAFVLWPSAATALASERPSAHAYSGAEGGAQTYRFDIPAGEMDAALAQFQAIAGVTVEVPRGTTLQGLSSPGVTGTHTAEQALEYLLAGTGLTFRLFRTNVYALEVRPVSENVEVVAGLPDRADTSATATKTLTPLRDVPQAVSVITKAAIADLGMQNMADVVRYVPGVGMAQGEGNRDTPVFRGNSTTADFFVDGVRDDVQYFRDLYNVDRVEALKGPNAMIFGRGGAGGVINRATRQADWARARELTLQTGSHDNRRVTLDLDQPINGAVAARVTGMYENSDSYRGHVDLERYGFNPTVAFMLGNATTLRVGYERFYDDRTADRGIPSRGDGPVDVHPATFVGDPGASEAWVTVNAFTAVVDHRVGGSALLRSRLRYADYDKFYQNVFASGAVNASGLVPISAYNNATARHNLFSQTDLTFSATTGSIRHVLLAGTELGRQVTDNFRTTGFFTAAGPNVTSIAVPISAPTVSVPLTFRQAATDADNHGTATVAALYAQDQIAFSRHLQAIVGLRYDRFEVDFHNNRTGTNLRSVDNLASPRAGLIVKPIEPVSVYASYTLAYMPRAGEQLSSLSLTNAALDPEKFSNYEVGAKWDVRPGLSFTTAVYQLDRTNVVIPDPADATRSLLVDGQRTRGVEVGLSGNITSRWSTMGAYAYQDGTITRTLSASAPAGATLAMLPAHTFSLWSRYDFAPRWGAGLGIIHSGEMFTSTDNTVRLPAFTRVDGALFVTLTNRLRAQLNLENMFDERYFAFAHNNNNITPGSPRAARVSLITRF